MKSLGLLILLVLALLTLFVSLNWTLITASTSLNLMTFTVQGSLGLILLAATLLVTVLFVIDAVSLRASGLLDARRHAKALQAQRDIADKAEASRYASLGVQVERESASVRALLQESRTELLQRLDALDQAQNKALSETTNAIFANIGQLDDKLNRLAVDAGRPAPGV
jgi:hypothetical protein